MNQPSFSKLLAYVAVFIIAGGLYNHFRPLSRINGQEISFSEEQIEEEDTEGVKKTIFKRADFLTLGYPINYSRAPKKVLIETNNGTAPLLVRDIIYCEKKSNSIYIYLNDGQFIESKITLKGLKTKIKDPFFIYDELNSYIINFDFVKEVVSKRSEMNQKYYSYSVTINDGTSIPLPKDKKAKFMKELERYVDAYQ